MQHNFPPGSFLEDAGPAPRAYYFPRMTVRGREFVWGARTYIMGILNVTPDSFSGDGLGANPPAAAAKAQQMEAEGADWLDVGGESSRPGAAELDPAEEARRVIPSIEAVRAVTTLPISVDTYHASVARQAIAAGADAVNDIWGLRRDPLMASVIAETGTALIAMHNQRGRPLVSPHAVAATIRHGWDETLRICREHGISPDRIMLDPGFGFGWTPEQNILMFRQAPELQHSGFPLLLGTSRKSTIGHILDDRPAGDRVFGTASTVALAVAAGFDVIRVHDVTAMCDVVRVADAVAARGPSDSALEDIAISLGSNLGDRLANLRAAVQALADDGIDVAARSAVWETAPVPADQPAFLNAVVTARTTRSPQRLLETLKRIEYRLGRRPERRWGPRPIDLDILFYGGEALRTSLLTIPHQRILERSFVLAPLAEVLPGPLPLLGVTAADALASIGCVGLRRFGDL